MKSILSLIMILTASTAVKANSLNEINKFASGICGKVATQGSIESSKIKATIEGKITPKALAKILGARVAANGSISVNNSNYDGLPYESLPAQMTDARQCRKEVVFMLLGERQKLRPISPVINKYAVKKNNHRLMLMKGPDFSAYNDIFNKHPLQIKLLIDGTKVDLLEKRTVHSNGIPLVWHRIKVVDGPNAGLIGWLPQGHLTVL